MLFLIIIIVSLFFLLGGIVFKVWILMLSSLCFRGGLFGLFFVCGGILVLILLLFLFLLWVGLLMSGVGLVGLIIGFWNGIMDFLLIFIMFNFIMGLGWCIWCFILRGWWMRGGIWRRLLLGSWLIGVCISMFCWIGLLCSWGGSWELLGGLWGGSILMFCWGG